jgi:Zn-dependent M28 family amino/carboxypeptidase
MRSPFPALLLVLASLAATCTSTFAPGQTAAIGSATSEICAACVHADLNFLASDELHGRGSGTRDEHLAALYAASLFQTFGLEPAGEKGTYIQRAPLPAEFPEVVAGYIKRQGFDRNQRTDTWNALALLRGTNDAAVGTPKEVILLTAHLDHLGLGNPVNGDSIYNGADDDASGTTAVLELARALSHGPRPKRSILFVLFGSEELGGYGNKYFLDHPPVPLTQIVANLEFEMIGRSDPALPSKTLWLTGYDRSNLGPTLAQHGAAISADPHPAQHFFQRSDNYALAKRGIVAQTVSSYGLHKDYHQPSDEISKIDFDFLIHSIGSMTEPVRWLANSDWHPTWNPGGKP